MTAMSSGSGRRTLRGAGLSIHLDLLVKCHASFDEKTGDDDDDCGEDGDGTHADIAAASSEMMTMKIES
jgi:hypothetical protein